MKQTMTHRNLMDLTVAGGSTVIPSGLLSAVATLVFRAALAIALLGPMASAIADSPFVNTEHLKPHVFMGPPEIIPANKVLLAPAEHQFMQRTVEPTPGAAASVAGAKRPLKAAGGYDGRSGARTYAAQAAHRVAVGYGMAAVRHDDAATYEDGSGRRVGFGYERSSGQLALGWTPNRDIELKVVGVADLLDNDRQPHHALDAVKTDRMVGKAFLTFRHVGPFDELEWRFAAKDLDRAANNFKLRPQTATDLRTDVDLRAYEIGGTGKFKTGTFDNAVGFDAETNRHDAVRFNVTAGDIINSFRFPDVARDSVNVWGETGTNLGNGTRLKAGLRYDYQYSEPDKAHLVPGTAALFQLSAAQLYKIYYGVTDMGVVDHNVSGRLRLEHDVTPDVTLFGDLSRLVRNPNNIERWHALSGPAASRWVGNPSLDAEKHHKAEAGVHWKGPDYRGYGRKGPEDGTFLSSGAWRLGLSGFYDKVDDFVTLDRARGQSGVLLADSATVARNVDATKAGVELHAEWTLTRNLSTRALAVFTYGENDSDDRALYQVPPFEANWLVDYTDDLAA